jgi:hypothetical protein
MEVINAIATNRNLLVIEDAAQAHGAIANSKFQIPNPQKQVILVMLLLVSTLRIWGTWRWWCHNYK